MRKNISIKINAILNIIKSLLSVVFPVITYPYATRVLGVENIGRVDFGASIVSYFSLLASFGLTTYAIREGTRVRDEKEKFKSLADELFSINVIITFFSYIVLGTVLLVIPKFSGYRVLILLQSLSIMFTTLGVDWVNTIYEDFLYTTLRSIFTHIISLILMFLVVKTADDYYQYAALTVISNGFICVLNILYCRKYNIFRLVVPKNYKKHLKKMFVFFANAIAVSIYVSADTTMLGLMVGDYAVGVYSVAVKIYSIVKQILVAVYSVALPRLTALYVRDETKQYSCLFSKIVSVILILLLPAAAGISVFSKEIIYVIGGEKFLVGAETLSILGVALIFAIVGGILTQCVNVSVGMEKETAKATVVSAIVNLVLNVPFILLFQQNGAAITTAISEFIVFAYCAYKSRAYLKLFLDKSIWKNLRHSLLGTVLVAAVGFLFSMVDIAYALKLTAGIFVSLVAYASILIIFRNDIVVESIRKIKFKFESRG